MFAYNTHFNTSTFFLESRLLNLGNLLTYRQKNADELILQSYNPENYFPRVLPPDKQLPEF